MGLDGVTIHYWGILICGKDSKNTHWPSDDRRTGRSELGRLYRQACRGEVAVADASRLATILAAICANALRHQS